MYCVIHSLRRSLPLPAGLLLMVIASASVAQEGRVKLAKSLIERGGVTRGVAAVVGIDGRLSLDIATESDLLVHVRDPRGDQVKQLRAAADEAKLDIRRLAVEQGEYGRLPYADNTIDAVICTQPFAAIRAGLTAAEVLRVLRPGGVAIIGKPLSSEGPDVDLAPFLPAAGGDEPSNTISDDLGTWAVLKKPIPDGIDEWTHWEKSGDNNPVSNDSVIRAPYMTQFMAEPLYIGMPSITTAAGGRTFLAIGHIAHHPREWDTLNKLICRNGYNGQILWERKLPEGYLVHRSAFVAGQETFHMIDGQRCLLLDAATGREQGEIRIDGLAGEWKWMVIQDGILYALAGKPDGGVTTTKGDRTFGGWSWADLSQEYYGEDIPVGFGEMLAAYDIANKKTLWIHKEETPIDSRGMALRDGRLYMYCPDRHLRALSAESGDVLWTNADEKVLGLIDQPGQGLTSTPGWRTQTLVVATPKSLIIQGQTRMNVVGVSTEYGELLWTKRKITNNPNAIYLDGNVILGVGEGGTHAVIDPVSGEEKANLGFRKAACTRLTACADSLFCRGEGTLRFDRESGKVLVDGAQRPACNDGALPAHGLLYLGPWQCDCNLSLIGCIAKCSAGDFKFDVEAKGDERLVRGEGDVAHVAPLEVTEGDWPTDRGGNDRSAGTGVEINTAAAPAWRYRPPLSFIPTAPVSAAGFVFFAGEDGKVRAIDAARGTQRWEFATASPIKQPPSVAEGRLYFGGGDGYAYCLEAATGRLLWRFRAAPVERHIMAYGSLSSTWPVNSGVLVEEGIAYFAAGIIDHDGTYVYAVDAISGDLKWQNNSSGHLSEELKKGVSVQGNLSILGDQLLLAGGNQVSPAVFDKRTGECRARSFDDGRPKASGGRYVGVFKDQAVIVGGRVLYSAPENVATKNGFTAFSKNRSWQLTSGGVPPAWNDTAVALVNFKQGKLTVVDAEKVTEQFEKRPSDEPASDRRRRGNLADSLAEEESVRWSTDLDQPQKFEAVSPAVAANAVVACVQLQQRVRAHPQWYLAAFDLASGKPLFQHALPTPPLPGGLLIDRDGGIVVTLLSGEMLRYR